MRAGSKRFEMVSFWSHAVESGNSGDPLAKSGEFGCKGFCSLVNITYWQCNRFHPRFSRVRFNAEQCAHEEFGGFRFD